jgi:hypothetical protein
LDLRESAWGTYRWNWRHTPTNTLASIVLLRAPNQLVGRLHIVYIRVSLYDDIMESIGGWSHHTHTSPLHGDLLIVAAFPEAISRSA